MSLLGQGKGSQAHHLTASVSSKVFQAASEGNSLAIEVVSHACHVLGWAIAQAANLLAPERVIIGGGVSLSGEKLFFEPVRHAARKFTFPPLSGSYDIVPAELGEEVVLHGALISAATSDPEK